MPRAPGGGSNTLRGGKNSYQTKTRCGNWFEDEYKPGISTKSFTTRHFSTTAGDQMREGARAKTETFGAEIPSEALGKFNHANIINPDTTRGSNTWQTVARSTLTQPGKKQPAEFSSAFHLKRTLDEQGMDNYRQRWTRESEIHRSKRFTTEAEQLGKPVAAKFRPVTLRALPGRS